MLRVYNLKGKGVDIMREINLKVEGMACTGCENRVKNALSTLDGVESVEASFEKCFVNVKLSKDVSLDTVKETIEDLGFTVKE